MRLNGEFLLRNRRRSVALGVAGAVLLGSGVAVAAVAIPGPNGVIEGCYNNAAGVLRVVSDPSQCLGSTNPLVVRNPALLETPLAWNQTGPKGDPGAAGISVTTTSLAVGDPNCPTGGQKLTAANGVGYVCNGAVGPTGPAGPSADVTALTSQVNAQATAIATLQAQVKALQPGAGGGGGTTTTPPPPGSIAVGTGPFGIAINTATHRIFVANGGSSTTPGNSVSVIDAVAKTLVSTVTVGSGPSGVAVNSTTNRAYVANTNSNSVSVIDGASNAVMTSIPVPGPPLFLAVNSTTNRVYVTYAGTTGPGGNTVSVIDGAANTVLTTLTVGTSSGGVAVNPTTNRVYVADSGTTSAPGSTISVIDGATNTVQAPIALPAGQRQPFAVGVNPTAGRLYVSQESQTGGGVTVFDASTNAVVAAVNTAGSIAAAIAANPVPNGRVYLATVNGSSIAVQTLDGSTNALVPGSQAAGPFSSSSPPPQLDIDPGANVGYVTNYQLNVIVPFTL